VVVSAVAGSSKVACNQAPSPYSSSDTNSVVYNAWGTTFNVHCQMPTADTFDAPLAPTKEGLAALENWKKEGPRSAPE